MKIDEAASEFLASRRFAVTGEMMCAILKLTGAVPRTVS